jgi:REP element-mobilizing transposase RayT
MGRLDYIDFQERTAPLAYLITIRAYGTWLHGDERGSVDRRSHNKYGAPNITPNERLSSAEKAQLRHPPLILSQAQRAAVEQAIREVAACRGYQLLAVNVRTNHVHCVVVAGCKPESLLVAFKAYSTRLLRRAGLISSDIKPWSRHGSTLYLWTEDEVERAIDYVINAQ